MDTSRFRGIFRSILILSIIVLLVRCGGGGGGDSPGTSTAPAISSLSASSAMPTQLLTITGSGFNTAATLSVSFFDDNGFKADIPVLSAGSTSLTVAVPPYIDTSTGRFSPGIVNIQVIQRSGSSTTASNTIQNFQVQDLPALGSSPGVVTLNMLNGIIDYYLQLQEDMEGTVLDVSALSTAVSGNIANLQNLASQIQSVMQNPSTTFTLGSMNGNEMEIGVQSLIRSDRLFLGMFEMLSDTGGSASLTMSSALAEDTSLPCQQEADAEIDFLLHIGDQVSNTSGYRGYADCASGGLPVAVKTTNEVIGGAGTAAVGILSLAGAPAMALALPGAALFSVSAMNIVTQIDIAAALKNSNDAASYQALHQTVDDIESTLKDLLLGQFIPEAAGSIKNLYSGLSSVAQAFGDTASLTPTPPSQECTYTYSAWSACQPNNTQTRTVISSSPDGCTGTPILSRSCTYTPSTCTYSISPTDQSFAQTGGTGSVSVSTSSDCSWTAASNDSWITISSGSSGTGNGTVYYSVASNNSATQLTGTMTIAGETFTITQAGAGGVTGTWSGTMNQPGAAYSGCPAQTVSLSLYLVEDENMNITGSTSNSRTITSGSRSGTTITVTLSTMFGSRGPYTWTWDGANTITGSMAYFCYDLSTGALISEGIETFTVTRQ